MAQVQPAPECTGLNIVMHCNWALTMGLLRRLMVIQRAIARALLGVNLRDQIRSEEIRRRTSYDIEHDMMMMLVTGKLSFLNSV
ncbi:jg23825 [Pararge aegeria aegeria]|uniref:Jg23825 protein n=1 Tax=Pararge aegeria aegeria TaxID=348720 RepID=A0A8S4SMZ7_9NEOP|nr:jg23825 [Pararge aegeria aegeria]